MFSVSGLDRPPGLGVGQLARGWTSGASEVIFKLGTVETKPYWSAFERARINARAWTTLLHNAQRQLTVHPPPERMNATESFGILCRSAVGPPWLRHTADPPCLRPASPARDGGPASRPRRHPRHPARE